MKEHFSEVHWVPHEVCRDPHENLVQQIFDQTIKEDPEAAIIDVRLSRDVGDDGLCAVTVTIAQ